jgi:hypothetical protein
MAQTCEGPPRGGSADGPGKASCLEGIDGSTIAPKTAPSQAEISRDPRAVREAKLELLREAIFENLGAISLFAETAKLLIEARDDAGMAHSVKMGARRYRAAVVGK